jgi:hypothetical protein
MATATPIRWVTSRARHGAGLRRLGPVALAACAAVVAAIPISFTGNVLNDFPDVPGVFISSDGGVPDVDCTCYHLCCCFIVGFQRTGVSSCALRWVRCRGCGAGVARQRECRSPFHTVLSPPRGTVLPLTPLPVYRQGMRGLLLFKRALMLWVVVGLRVRVRVRVRVRAWAGTGAQRGHHLPSPPPHGLGLPLAGWPGPCVPPRSCRRRRCLAAIAPVCARASRLAAAPPALAAGTPRSPRRTLRRPCSSDLHCLLACLLACLPWDEMTACL